MIGLLWWTACTTPAVPLNTDTDTVLIDSGDVDTGDVDTGAPSDPDRPLELCINELMPSNAAAFFDENGDTPDWLELHNPGKQAVDASGWSLTDDVEDITRSILPEGTEIPAGGFLLLLADGQDIPGHVDFRLSASGGSLGLFAPDGRGQIIHHGKVQTDFSIARSPDCCTETDCLVTDFHGTPGISNVPLIETEVTVLEAGATWAFWDRGEAPTGGDWTAGTYDDSAWATGPAPLGFGDSHHQTTIDGGPADARHPTTWSRISFSVDSLQANDTAWIDLMIDDGTVVWLNGQEALRVNMPEGDITADTLASAAVGAPNESLLIRYTLDASLLQEGDNLLALEIHQASANSSDLTWDAALGIQMLRPDTQQ